MKTNVWKCPCGCIITRRYRSSKPKQYWCPDEQRYRKRQDLILEVEK